MTPQPSLPEEKAKKPPFLVHPAAGHPFQKIGKPGNMNKIAIKQTNQRKAGRGR